MFRTELADQKELDSWNQIISKCNYSEALHTIEWKNALISSFKQFEPLYFVIKDEDDNIVGALPSLIFSPIPFNKSLLSMPWTLPGGFLKIGNGNIESIYSSVIKKLGNISKEKHLSEIILTLPVNYDNTIADMLLSNGYTKKEHFTHILRIDEGFDIVWNSYNKRIRGAVRKAEKSGVIVRETVDESDMIDFYKMYLTMMNNFGSTPKPLSLLKYLQKSSIAKLIIAELNGKIIAGLLFLHFNSYVRLWCETSDPEFLGYRPNNAIINYIIKWSCNYGYCFIDFGASPLGNEGLIAFKEEWGAKKAWFSTFTKINSAWRKKLWTISEPSIRRIYAEFQRFKV